ncbi:MAG: Na+/H+ antiporter subunit E [Candidatus Kapaibacterium sp.]
MKTLLVNILLALAWMLLTGNLHIINFVEGIIIGYAILYVSNYAVGSDKYFSRLPKIVFFIFYFLKELVLANLKIAYDIITPKDRMRPGVIALPLDAESDFEITMLANLITLTPGTLSLDTSDDKKTLYIHAMYLGDPQEFKMEIKNGLERRLLEVTR